MNGKMIFLIGSALILSVLRITQPMVVARSADVGFSLPITSSPAPRMIMIYGSWEGKDVIPQIEPDVLWIDRSTEVTWINVSQSNVKIRFGKGTDCKEVTPAAFPALGVRLDPQKCFVISNSIPPKGTLRFRFKEPGEFNYEVEYIGKNLEMHGDIRVY